MLAVPSTWFTKPLKEVATISYSDELPQEQQLIYSYAYEENLKFNGERSPSGWWDSIEHYLYPNIPTYYQINNIQIKFGV